MATIEFITKEDWFEVMNVLNEIKNSIQRIKNQDGDTWLTPKEASKLLSVSVRTLQTYRDKHMIAFSQRGRKIMYKEKDIQDFLEKNYIK